MTDFLTRTERVYLVAATALIAVLGVTNLVVAVLTPILYPPPFAIYDNAPPSLFPLFHLLSLITPFFIIWGRRFIFSLLYASIALIPAYLQFLRAHEALIANFESVETYNSLRILLMIANPLEYATFVLSNLIVVWLATVVIRSFTQTAVGSGE